MIKQLLALSIVMLLVGPLFADGDVVKEPQPVALEEVDTVKLENYQLKITLIERQLQSMRSGAERWIMGLFNKYELSPKEWRFDVQKVMFIKVVENE